MFICYENHPIFAKTLFVPLPSCSFSFLFFLFWPVWSVPLKYLLISECFFQEHLVRTRCGSVTVAVYGDEDKPALITYPDVALNCKCFQRFFFNLMITVMTEFHNRHANIAYIFPFPIWLGQTCPVSKDCSSARKLRLCSSTISASTTSILRGTRSVMVVQSLWCDVLGLYFELLTWSLRWQLLRVLQLGAAPISSDVPVPSVDDLADQVADVLDFFRYCIVTWH